METIHVKNLEKYQPGYKDRSLIWCKVYFSMINADPDFELLDEIDKWRFICFCMLEIQTKKPVPANEDYLSRKGFNFSARSLHSTLMDLGPFLEVVGTIDVTENEKTPYHRVEKSRVEKSRVEKSRVDLFVENSQEMELAKLLFDLIAERDKKIKTPNFQNWAKEINRIYKLDERSWEEIKLVILWSQKDSFWKNNILSPHKLRRQFQMLLLKAKDTNEYKQYESIKNMDNWKNPFTGEPL